MLKAMKMEIANVVVEQVTASSGQGVGGKRDRAPRRKHEAAAA